MDEAGAGTHRETRRGDDTRQLMGQQCACRRGLSKHRRLGYRSRNGLQRQNGCFERVAGLGAGCFELNLLALGNRQRHDGGRATHIGALAAHQNLDGGTKRLHGVGEQGTRTGVQTAGMTNDGPAVGGLE